MTTSDNLPTWLSDVASEQPYPLVFATVSGAHLYGFASVDSDVDVRGVHLLPAHEVVGLTTGPETLQHMGIREGVELDVVTHDLLKFSRLLLKNYGYAAEQLLSPLVVATSPLHAALVDLAPRCVTRHHVHHYLGFSTTTWKLFERTGGLKPALYTLRALMTGINLMRTGMLVTDLRVLWTGHQVPYVPELIAAKHAGEHDKLTGIVSAPALEADIVRLRATLEEAAAATSLPDKGSADDEVHRLIVEARLGSITQHELSRR